MLTPLALPKHPEEARRRPREKRRVSDQHRQYYLEVHLRIAAANQDEFAEQGKALLDTFKAKGLTLAASAWHTNSDPITIVNYWDIGNDADALLEAELALPDVPKFNAFNKLIDHEIKTIAIPIAASERVALPNQQPQKKLSSDFRYLRVSMEVDPASLPEFGARVEGYMAKFTRDAGWALGSTFYSITGTAGQVSQLWIIHETDSRGVEAKLRGAPWLAKDLIKKPPTFDILRATPADPNLDPSRDAQ